MKQKINLLYSWFVWLVTFFLPDISFTMRFRGWMYSLAMPESGKNFQVSSGARLYGLNKISVGDDVYIATNVVINAGEEVVLGSEVMIGIGAIIVSGNHSLFNGSYRFGSLKREPILVHRGSWISANVVLVSGSEIPKSSLIAANSVVTKKLKISGVYAGAPAELKSRD
ncbi:acyltransferase [Vibrio parahaemolyticus]|nr:acyltransferase [Vibrio parahaemolyticus]